MESVSRNEELVLGTDAKNWHEVLRRMESVNGKA